MDNYRPYRGIPPAVMVILIINAAIYLLIDVMAPQFGINLVDKLAMHLPGSEHFSVYQYITHMFTHEEFWHMFFNMFAVYMFGRILETVWGTKRFIFYYIVTGLGAAALHSLVSWWGVHNMQEQYQAFITTPDAGLLADFLRKYRGGVPANFSEIFDGITNGSATAIEYGKLIYEKVIQVNLNVGTIGASGAVFGILLAFGMLFPNTELFLMFIPIPIKAKYFVIGYGLIELFFGLRNAPGDNIAHFAHLGGMLFGYFLVRYWRKHSKRFY